MQTEKQEKAEQALKTLLTEENAKIKFCEALRLYIKIQDNQIIWSLTKEEVSLRKFGLFLCYIAESSLTLKERSEFCKILLEKYEPFMDEMDYIKSLKEIISAPWEDRMIALAEVLKNKNL